MDVAYFLRAPKPGSSAGPRLPTARWARAAGRRPTAGVLGAGSRQVGAATPGGGRGCGRSVEAGIGYEKEGKVPLPVAGQRLDLLLPPAWPWLRRHTLSLSPCDKDEQTCHVCSRRTGAMR